jgi:RNA polymerase sigma factor (sigma-70 family)
MAKSPLSRVVQRIRGIMLQRGGDGITDGHLLELFIAERDDAAFEALLRRHGPPVLGVCRRVLDNEQDAEDAFQTTFLVLARKAGSIRPRQMVGNWLYGVAYRTAQEARRARARRKAREKRLSEMPRPHKMDDSSADLRQVLDRELTRLPDNYRAAIVLCDLEGMTQKQVAQQLGWPEGTVASRLARARALLAKRLVRHGPLLSAASLAAALAQSAAPACVPPTLALSTLNAASLLAAGKAAASGIVSANVMNLMEGVMKSMLMTKLKVTTALVLAVGVIAAGMAGFTFRLLAADEPQNSAAKAAQRAGSKAPDKDTKPNKGLDDVERLQGEWHAVDFERDGKSPRQDPTGIRMTFKGDELIMGEGKSSVVYKYRLASEKAPRELHLTILFDGKDKGQSFRCIYLLDKAELKICMPLGPESAHPTEFKTKVGDGLVLFVLRRPDDAAAVIVAANKSGDVASIKRKWLRSDAPPDGNYKLSFVRPVDEVTFCLIKLETKDQKQSASLIDTDPLWKVSNARIVGPTTPFSLSPNSLGQASAKSGQIRVVLATPMGEGVFDGRFTSGSLEARGSLEVSQGGEVLPATLRATDLTKLKYTVRELPTTRLQEALLLGRAAQNLKRNAEGATDVEEKARLLKKAALRQKQALAEAPKLFKVGFEKYADDPHVFDAALAAAQLATKYRIGPEQLAGMIAKADEAAKSYGRLWHLEFNAKIAGALANQKDYADLALEIASRLDKELVGGDAGGLRARALKALAAAQASAGHPDAAKEALARLLDVEALLDRDYRERIPPFKVDVFKGRKAASDRAVVLELFTGAQCPPCVAAEVAFDALHKTYQPAELVLIQYHLHIPGPDPLTNRDSEARWEYYGKSFPDEARGVPTTLFNGKPKESGGGAIADAEGRYNKYREVIDPLLETDSAAKLSASAVRRDNKINIQAEVAGLKNPGTDVRLRLLLVEETIRYVGPNRVRFHHDVVRGVVGGADGFALSDKNSKHAATVDVDALRKSLGAFLDDYERDWQPFPNSDRPLDLANLRVIALVQDDATREILQAALVEVKER